MTGEFTWLLVGRIGGRGFGVLECFWLGIGYSVDVWAVVWFVGNLRTIGVRNNSL